MRDRRSTASLHYVVSIAATAACLAMGCDGADQMRSALESHRTEWAQRISTLRSRDVDLEAALAAIPADPGGAGAPAARLKRRRLQASIVGARQTLADMEAHAADGTREVEAAIGRNDPEAQVALNGLVDRMNEYVRQQEQALAANTEAMTRVGKDVGP
jgi:hypothetical protein